MYMYIYIYMYIYTDLIGAEEIERDRCHYYRKTHTYQHYI